MATEVSDVVSDVADLAVDVKDLTVEHAEKVVTVVRHNPMLAIGVGLVGLSAGLVIGYKYAEKKFMEQFDTKLAEEIDAEIAAVHRISEEKDPILDKPTKLVVDNLADARAILREQGYTGEAVVTETVVEHSVTVDGLPLDYEFDYATELELRNPEFPYIITNDEFLENEPGHAQVTITWYSGDNTLADEREEPIENLNYTVGAENLDRFGHGSRDTNIVYVRNEKLGIDFEILRSLGEYAQEVMQFTQEERTERALKNRIKHGDD